MEVKIGVQHANRELVLDSNQSADDVLAEVRRALSGEGDVLDLTDSKGRRVVVPAAKIAFVELGSPSVGQVGFRS